MSGLSVPSTLAPLTSPEDPRLGRWLAGSHTRLSDARVILVGFPSDAGVARNGGRPGASGGPAAIREALYKMTPDARSPEAFTALLEQTVDAGDIAVLGDVEADQHALADTIAPWVGEKTVIVLGGGHETAYGHLLGYCQAQRDVHVLNWDAHADVREVGASGAHSGSPFRQALEHSSGHVRSYSVAGLHPWRVAAAHADWIRARGGRIAWGADLDRATIDAFINQTPRPAMASFDIDAVAAPEAPGVSAPGVGGLSPRLWLHAAEASGRARGVGSFEVVEANPRLDQDGRTAALAALTVWHILRGLAAR